MATAFVVHWRTHHCFEILCLFLYFKYVKNKLIIIIFQIMIHVLIGFQNSNHLWNWLIGTAWGCTEMEFVFIPSLYEQVCEKKMLMNGLLSADGLPPVLSCFHLSCLSNGSNLLCSVLMEVLSWFNPLKPCYLYCLLLVMSWSVIGGCASIRHWGMCLDLS